MSMFKNLMEKLSLGKELKQGEDFELLGNTYGFYGMSGGVGVSTIVLELASLLSSDNLRVCIIDCNPYTNFYTSRYISLAGTGGTGEVPGVNKRFMNSSCPLSDCLIDASHNLKVLSFGDAPYTDSLDLNLEIITSLYKEVRNSFDIVLVDIPNIPCLESVIAGVSVSNMVYSVWDYSTEPLLTHMKAQTYFNIAGLRSRFNTVVINKVPYGMTIKKSMQSATDSSILLELPYVRGLNNNATQGSSALEGLKGKGAKAYADGLDFIINEMLNGIEGGVQQK